MRLSVQQSHAKTPGPQDANNNRYRRGWVLRHFGNLGAGVVLSMSAREVKCDQGTCELNRSGGPEGSEDRSIAHFLRVSIITDVRDSAVN